MAVEKTIITNMCMIYDNEGHILVQDRVNPDWAGITFPGGHVEKEESFVNSVVREVKEETGLLIKKPILCGIKQFQTKNNERYVVLLFKTNQYSGNLKSSREGKVFWIHKDQLFHYPLAEDFDKMFEIFENNNVSELYYDYNDKYKIL